jgi:hypothetical protein
MQHLSTPEIRVERATPADIVAWAAMQRNHGFPLPRRMYKCLLAQVAVFEAWTLRETDREAPLVIAGCVDLEAGSAGEIFFLSQSGGLGRRLVRVHRLALRWLAEVAANHPAGLVCFVQPDNANGQRLALAIGFSATGFTVEGFEQWRMPGGHPKPSNGEGRVDVESGQGGRVDL